MFAAEMLQSARHFFAHAPPAAELPDRYETEDDAIRAMMGALLYEAHASMAEPIAMPTKPMLNAVDLASDEPGIIDSVTEGTVNVVRAAASSASGGAATRFVRRQVETVDESEPVHVAPAKLKRALAAAERQGEAKRARDERAATKKKAASDERKAARAAKQAPAAPDSSHADEAAAARDAEHAADAGGGAADAEAAAAGGAEAAAAGGAEEAAAGGAEEAEARPPKPPRVLSEADFDVEYAAPRVDALPARRKRRPGDPLTVHESPVPHDRHVRALTTCAVHPRLLPTLLRGTPAAVDGLTIIEGPPGTGKTSRLIEDVHAYVHAHPTHRVLVCAPSNSGACDLFARALRRGVVGHLSVGRHVVPAGVCRTELVPLARARVLFSTLSGRNAARMQAQRVHAVFVDEAAQCPEALVWGVLRREVEALYMVGDTRQLAALVSPDGRQLGHARSMMERLQAIGVRAAQLTEQRRMHPEILSFPNARFYGGSLTTAAARVDRTVGRAYELVDVRGDEERVGTSYRNAAEAAACVRIAKALPYEHVRILAPYAAQVECILGLGSGVPVCTVDSFQGQEADAVILCLVRVGEQGFWADDRRLNVALTRAKHAMRVVGSVHSYPAGCTLARLAEDALARGCLARA